MKAPDKLYIGRRNYGPLIGGWVSHPFTSKEIESIEYIRKDALLEWLQKKVGVSYGVATEAFVEVLDKLSKM